MNVNDFGISPVGETYSPLFSVFISAFTVAVMKSICVYVPDYPFQTSSTSV